LFDTGRLLPTQYVQLSTEARDPLLEKPGALFQPRHRAVAQQDRHAHLEGPDASALERLLQHV
jgi:hypothetical protein